MPSLSPLLKGTMGTNDSQGTGPQLPFQHLLDRGETVNVAGTNVVRVPFGVRQSRRLRPQRQATWATLVLPLHSWEPTPPPQAA